MKKIIMTIFVVLLLANFAVGAKVGKLGPCVKECVSEYNPSMANSCAEEFQIIDFKGQYCVDMCKAELENKVCSVEKDGCCNMEFFFQDSDCTGGPEVIAAGNTCDPALISSGEQVCADNLVCSYNAVERAYIC